MGCEVLERFREKPTREIAEEIITRRTELRISCRSEVGFLLKKLSKETRECRCIKYAPIEEIIEMRKHATFVEYLREKYNVPWLEEKHFLFTEGYNYCRDLFEEIKKPADWVIAKALLTSALKKKDPDEYLSALGISYERAHEIIRGHYSKVYDDFKRGAKITRDLLRRARAIRGIEFFDLETTFVGGIRHYKREVSKLFEEYGRIGQQPLWVLYMVDPRGASDFEWVRTNYLEVIRKMEQDFRRHKEYMKTIEDSYNSLSRKKFDPIKIINGDKEEIERAKEVLREIANLEKIILEDHKLLKKYFYLTYRDRENVLSMLRDLKRVEGLLNYYINLSNTVLREPIKLPAR